MVVVSDSIPLIALNRINKIDLLQKLYKEITIPKAVEKEVFLSSKKISLNKLSWIKVESLNQPLTVGILSTSW